MQMGARPPLGDEQLPDWKSANVGKLLQMVVQDLKYLFYSSEPKNLSPDPCESAYEVPMDLVQGRSMV